MNDSFVAVTNNKKAKKQRHKSQISSTQPLPVANADSGSSSQSTMDAIFSSVVNPVAVSDKCCSNTTVDMIGVNKCRCEELNAEIRNLNSVIAQLSTKMEFIMSYLGLKEDENTAPNVQTQLATVSTGSVAISTTQTMNYANAIITKPKTQLSGQLRQAVMSAVYSDLHSKSTRANNFIISGLPKLGTSKDEDTVCDLIEHEFSFRPSIQLCRRLGKVVSDKTQNLLVTLKSEDQVKTILLNAKQLRSSANSFVRINTFINADLTKAEATAAYEDRCHRRLQREERASRQQQQPLQANSRPRVNASSVRSHTEVAGGSSSSSNTSTQLNASVPDFLPASMMLPTAVPVFKPSTTSGPSSSHQSASPNFSVA
jgi:hypothetical protein